MKKFLNQAAEKIINNGHFGAQSVIILPNRRSEVFLKEEIKNLSTKSVWLPEFYPVDEFMQRASGLIKADNISIFFELFKIHENIAGSEAKTIDEFLTWAPVMLSDFNDIDTSMADAKDIFTQLSAIKAIQQWNPNGQPLTKLQKNYLHFFNSMYDYYDELGNKLISKGTGYQGLISRYLAENISALVKKHSWNNFLIVGINALAEAEIRIFDYINQNYKTDFIWDVDQYYFEENGSKNNQQEAGKHIRRIINRLKIKEPDNIGNSLSTSKKEIKILGVPKQVGQAKFIGQELQKQFATSNNPSQKRNPSSFLNTAIVLADEGLLIPLLNSLPVVETSDQQTIRYNVTLGFPLSNSQIEHFFITWIDLMISKSQNRGRIYTSDLISLLNNPIIKQLLKNNNTSGDALIKYVIVNNISIITFKELEDQFNSKGINIFHILSGLLNSNNKDKIITVLESLKDVLFSLITNSINPDILIREQVQLLIKIIAKLLQLITQYENIINYKAIKKIGRQLISQSNINLVGEPLHGIQIMGMLETRNLDFENIYILSTNEGIIPKTDNLDSFIPMDIRREYQLPLPSDKSDIYAYHFYRLLQCAKNISLIYSSDSDKLGGGEKSRFILQIENELSKINPLINIISGLITTDISQKKNQKTDGEIIRIEKNEQIQLKLSDIANSGYSPSLLTSYITCSLKFYFSNILKINTNKTIEESVEANTFGTVIHAALEEIYKPTIGKEIHPTTIKEQLQLTRQILSNQFKYYYKNGDLSFGKNLLIFEVAHNYVNNFLHWDIKNLSQRPAILQSTETKFISAISDGELIIKFKGIIDRIDKSLSDGTIRIIDYKTGRVTPYDLVVKNSEELLIDPKYAKAFQVIYYAWLLNSQYNIDKLETGIISLRNISEGFIPLVLKDRNNIQDYFIEFEELIVKLVREITDPGTPFEQTTDTMRCTWCDYRSICNR